jgi:hypothetical protein
MGIEVDREEFTDDDHAQFAKRLRENVEVLREVLARPGFGEGEPTIGVEVEMHLIGADSQPACVSQDVRERLGDPRCTLEIDAFNFEVNSQPVALAGEPFGKLDTELGELLKMVRGAAAESGARVLLAGTLPTLTVEYLRGPVLSDAPRYRAMSRTLRERRGEPFAIHIDGRESLQATCDDLTLEGANASLQVHLRVAPKDFPRVYNAAQLAAAPLLAVTGNSPYFDGKDLWDETRIALFKQATDTRIDEHVKMRTPARVSFGNGYVRDPCFLFEENVALHEPLLPILSKRDLVGGVPALDELRLHQGTVWNWNRAVFDPSDGGHLRLEHRVVASGPTRVDMLANAAFALGLTLGLAPRVGAWIPGIPFPYVERSFYRAAKYGLAADIAWPVSSGISPRIRPARELVLELVPVAEEALVRHGVYKAEAAELLNVIRERAQCGRTGAQVQRGLVAAADGGEGRARALARMVEEYQPMCETDVPVHRWKLATR